MHAAKRRYKDTLKLGLRKLFEQGQRFGVDILPRHFYSELPDIRELRASSQWKAPYSMVGVAGADIETQLSFVRQCCPPPIVKALETQGIHALASQMNGGEGFGPTEADFLYAFVATRRPRQIFQIGCGVSTATCLLAAESAGYRPELLCVEPYPTSYLLQEAGRDRITLIRQKAQLLDLKMIESLGDDVLFFVDSTHALGPAGEVSRIILEMLPRLKVGASVHFHDITFPYDYCRGTLSRELFFQHESALLHAFLVCNSRFRVLGSLSMLHYLRPDLLAEYLPNYSPAANDEGLEKGGGGHFPSSTYLEVVG
jgi:hypothetical protein